MRLPQITDVEITPLPRISGALFNCALNCALPSLFQKIHKIAQGDAEEANIESYKQLRVCFQDWYGLNRELTWREFDDFIRRYHFSELELIFAPVIRQFIANEANKQQTDENLMILRDIVEDPLRLIPEDLREYYSHNPNEALEYATPGRYFALQNREAEQYFYRPFGLSMRVHNWTTSGYVLEASTSATDANLQPIYVYLKQGHYELLPHDSVPDFQALTDPTMQQAIEYISSDFSSVTTNRVLGEIIPFVRDAVGPGKNHLPYISLPQYFQQAKEKKLHNDTPEGQLTFAVILLTLMQNDGDQAERDYANHYLSTLEATDRIEINGLTALILEQTQQYVDWQKEALTRPISESGASSIQARPQCITREAFDEILKTYKTTYVVYNCILLFLSAGHYGHNSGTIRALNQLLDAKKEQEMFTQEEIGGAIMQAINTDSYSAHRHSFFMNGTKSDSHPSTGTDQVLEQLKTKFI